MHGNGSMQSICFMYKLCFCVIHDPGTRVGVLVTAARFFFNQGRICERTVVSRDL